MLCNFLVFHVCFILYSCLLCHSTSIHVVASFTCTMHLCCFHCHLLKNQTHQASATAEASASPLKYIVKLGNGGPGITVYFNGDTDAEADARCV